MQKLFRTVIGIALSSLLCLGTPFAAGNTEGMQFYQKNTHLSQERKEKLAAEISRYHNADNLWEVLRDEFTLPHYDDNPAVQEKIEWFMNNQDFLLRSATRAAPYLHYILTQIKKRHLPAELVLLPIIESGYNPFSQSHMGAAGIWQLMPGTATGLGVKQDWWYDGRRDVIASTRAALNYLAYLQSFFDGNWLLAIAAYNTGEGNVLAAIKRNIRNGMDTDFWSLPVAQQTKDYVPSLLALAVIISHPERYPVYFPPVRNAPYLAQVDLDSQVSLRDAASFAGISYKKLIQLNPGFNQPTTRGKRPYKLVLPIENVVEFTENLTNSPLNRLQVNWSHYKVRSGDTLATIANKFNTTPKALKQLNHLAKNSVRQGTDLLIPNRIGNPASSAQETIFANVATKSVAKENTTRVSDVVKLASATRSTLNTPYTLQPGDTVYMVRKSDTLASIANRFRTSSKTIATANRLKNGKVTPGVQLLIPTHRLSDSKSVKKLQPGDTLYMVRRGDSIDKISRKFHTTPAAIRLTNLIDDSMLQEGLKIIVPTGNRFRV